MATNGMALTKAQIEQYHRDGFLVVHDLLDEDEVDALVAYEAESKPEGWRQSLLHHVDDPHWRAVAAHPRIVGIVEQLLGSSRPMIVQTMYMERKPAGGEAAGTPGIALHQDLHYLPCEPQSLLACWLAMNDTDAGNGGLCVVPGSHHHGLHQTQKNEDTVEHDAWEVAYEMRDRSGREWTERMYSYDIEGLDPDDIVCLTVPKGAGVFFTGLTIHGSFANRSRDRVRRAFATHYVDENTWVYRTDVQKVVPAR